MNKWEIDRKIPKIEVHRGWFYINDDIYNMAICPKCKKRMFVNISKFKYCPCCGYEFIKNR